MKKTLFLQMVLVFALSLGWAVIAAAQFNGVRTQFLMTSLLDNPAASGNSACLDLRMGGRNQWAGFDGAPRTSFASLSGRIGGGVTFAHGMGGFVVTDQVGPWSNTRLSLAYSTKVRLTNGARLSAGLAAGMTQYRLDIGSLEFPEFSATEDPALFGVSTSQTVFPTVDFGLWYENNQTFVSLSMLNALSTTLNEVTMTTNTGTTVVLMGGRYIKMDRRFGFRPAAQMRLTRGLPPSVDLQGAFSVDELVSLGLGYRTGSALVGVLSMKLFESMTVGYSYDFGVNDLSVGGRSAHELVISLTACDKHDPYVGPDGLCPAYD